MRELLSINSMNRNMAEGPRCTRRKQANPRRKKVEDIPDESDPEVEANNLPECRDSGNHSDGYHSNENELNHDEVSSNEGSFHGDDGYQSNKELREEERRSRGMNIQEYLSRSDTAIIYPEAPEEEPDNEHDLSGGLDDGLEDTILSCPYCDRVYKRATSLKEHIKYRHEKNANNFACSECNYSFAYKSQLERHMATHMPGRDQICEICNKAFVNIYRLQRHMLTHSTGNRKFKCSECHKAFKYKHHLKEHLRIHSGEKPYECPTCKKRFSHSGSYSSHISSKKCTPLKYVPPLHSEKAAPVKVVNDKMSHAINNPHGPEYMHPFGPHSFDHLDKPSMVPNQSNMMMPIHVKVENGDGASADKASVSMAASPPNDAVKKVLQIVGATVSKQQQEGQNTDVAKLKKTKQSSSETNTASPDTPVKQVDIVLPEMAREHLSSKSPSATQSPEVDGKRKNYSIVDYTLRKVNEAKAVEAFANVHLKKDKNACRYCQQLFYNPIELHQHERYLCEQNEDVKKVKNHASLTKFINFQREVVAMQENEQVHQERDGYSDDLNGENSMQNDEEVDECDKIQEIEVSDGDDSEGGDENLNEREEDMREKASRISENHQHALRAFFAMSQCPSRDGLEKISHLLSMPISEVEEWFIAMRTKQGISSQNGEHSPTGSEMSDSHADVDNHDSNDDNASVDLNDNDGAPSSKNDHERSFDGRGFDEPDCGQPLRITTSNSLRYSHLPPARADRGGLLMVGMPPEAHQNGLNLSKKALCNEEPIPLTKKRSSPMPQHTPDKHFKTDQPLDLSLPKHVKVPTYERRQPYFDNSKSVFHMKGYRSLPSTAPDFYIGSFKVDPRMGQPYFENNIRAHCNGQPDPATTAAILAHGPIDLPHHMYAHPIHNGYPDATLLAAAAHNPTKKLKLMDSLGLMSTGSPEMVGRHFMTEEELRKSLGVDVSLLEKQGIPYQQGSQQREESVSEGSLDESIGEMSLSRTRRRKDRSPRTVNGMYACSQCPKTFQKHSSLLRHVYEHSGKRPHQCKECGKAFKHKHHLMEHSRLHSGEKPYQCDKCLKKFSHSGSYSQHMNHRYSYCKREDSHRQLKKEPQSVTASGDDRE